MFHELSARRSQSVTILRDPNLCFHLSALLLYLDPLSFEVTSPKECKDYQGCLISAKIREVAIPEI